MVLCFEPNMGIHNFCFCFTKNKIKLNIETTEMATIIHHRKPFIIIMANHNRMTMKTKCFRFEYYDYHSTN